MKMLQRSRGIEGAVLLAVVLMGHSSKVVAETGMRLPVEAVASPLAEPAEHSLGGRRLFFTQQQRIESTSSARGSGPEPGVVEAASVESYPGAEPESISTGSTTSAGSPHAGSPAAHNAIGVFFDAMVSGPKGVQLLVNGLPCSVHVAPVRDSQDKAGQVDCPAVTRSRPQLNLFLLSGQLQVSRNQSLMGVLKPGQGL